jgi:hypothetical protein
MICEVYLTPEMERKFFTIYEKKGLNCTNEELVQQLFEEALTANYIPYKGASIEDKLEDAKNGRR